MCRVRDSLIAEENKISFRSKCDEDVDKQNKLFLKDHWNDGYSLIAFKSRLFCYQYKLADKGQV